MSTKYMSSSSSASSSNDELMPPKMSPEQESALDMHFNRNKTMHPSDVAILAAETGLPEESVQVKNKKKMMESRVISYVLERVKGWHGARYRPLRLRIN